MVKFNIITNESVPKNAIFLVPTHLRLVMVGDKLQVEDKDENGKTIVRDLTEDEKKTFRTHYFLTFKIIVLFYSNGKLSPLLCRPIGN